jgi:chloride channel 3/4/5
MDYLNQQWNDILSPLNNGSSSNNTSSNELFMNKGKNIVNDFDIEDEEAIPLYNRGSSNVNNNENDFEVNENNDFELEHAKYDDFSTIDWLRDIMSEKTGKKRKINKNSLNQLLYQLSMLHNHGLSYFLLVFYLVLSLHL